MILALLAPCSTIWATGKPTDVYISITITIPIPIQILLIYTGTYRYCYRYYLVQKDMMWKIVENFKLFYYCWTLASVFPTHRLYLGGPPRYINGPPKYICETFLFYYYYYLLHFFFIARDNETIRDRLNSGKISPRPTRFVLLVLCAQELSTLPQTISSVSHTLIYLWRVSNIHRLLPSAPASHTHERDFSTTFSHFQTLLFFFYYYQSQWRPPTVWLPTFFKISSFVFSTRIKINTGLVQHDSE